MNHPLRGPHHRWTWPTALIVVTLFAFGLRWYYVCTAIVIHPIRGDATQYFFYAWNLFNHGVFAGNHPGSAVLVASNYRDPGYPVFLAFWMAFFKSTNHWYTAVLTSQALLGALTIPCAMQLGRRWLDWRWAATAGVLMAVWPHSISINGYLLTETLFGFLTALAMLLCARACTRQSPWWAAAAGLCFGAAALTNAVLLPFGILLAIYLAWRRLIPRQVWSLLLVGALLLPGVWAIRNSQLPAAGSTHSSMFRAEQNLVQGTWPSYHPAYRAAIQGEPWAKQTMHAIGAEIDLLHTDPRQGLTHIGQRLWQHPWHALAWYTLTKPRVLWGWNIRVGQGGIYVYPTVNSPFRTNLSMHALAAICYMLNPILALLMLAALITAIFRSEAWKTTHDGKAMLEATLALLVFVTLVYTALQAAPRYSIPFRSFEMLLAVSACSALMSAWRRYHAKAHTNSCLPLPEDHGM